MTLSVDRHVHKRGKKQGAKAATLGNIEKANARFDRLLEAMTKSPALPKKRKRVRVREVPAENFDD